MHVAIHVQVMNGKRVCGLNCLQKVDTKHIANLR